MDFKKPNVKGLNKRYRGVKLQIDDIKVRIHRIIAVEGGIKVELKGKKDGRVFVIRDKDGKPITYTPERFGEVVFMCKRKE